MENAFAISMQMEISPVRKVSFEKFTWSEATRRIIGTDHAQK